MIFGRILWAYILFSICLAIAFISIAVSFSKVVAFKTKHERNSTKALLNPFISWPCKLPQPVGTVLIMLLPWIYQRLIMSISCVNYVHGSDTSTHQQIEANSAKTPPAQTKSRATALESRILCYVTRTGFRLRANCEILKLILNHTSCDLFFFFTKFKITTVEWRQLTFLPRPYGVHLNKFLLRLIIVSRLTMGWSILRLPHVSWGHRHF